MSAVKFFYDWLLMPPATLVAYVIVLPISLLPIVAGFGTWCCVAFVFEGSTDLPKRSATFVVATILALYVFLIVQSEELQGRNKRNRLFLLLPHGKAFYVFLIVQTEGQKGRKERRNRLL